MTLLPSNIWIENGAFKKIPNIARKFGAAFAIITDANLKKLGEQLLGDMRKSGLQCNLIILPAGEHTKSISFIEKTARSFVKIGIKRDSCVIGLGGGVIGDFTGFLASIYMRGINLILIPTTLLAMADAAIGKKTGVDLPEGKNLLGTFYDPQMVVMDPLLLSDLPQSALRAGMAEVIKHAVLADKELFKFLDRKSSAVMKKDKIVLKQIIEKSVRIKMNIVQKDERESIKNSHNEHSRMLLNYGHTVGHALEKLSGYTLSHGDAISIGMVAENRVAVGKKILKETDARRIESLLKKYGLPTKIPAQYGKAQIKKAIFADKKNVEGGLHFALPTKIGHAKVVKL